MSCGVNPADHIKERETVVRARLEDLTVASATNRGSLLRFNSAHLEGEFLVDSLVGKQRTMLIWTTVLPVLVLIEFLLGNFGGWLGDASSAAKFVGVIRIWFFLATTMVSVLSWRYAGFLEVLLLFEGFIVTVFLCLCNTYRVSRVFGSDMFDRYWAWCHADVCYEDASLLLSLVGIVAVICSSTAVRVAHSWTLVLLVSILYAAAGAKNLAPRPASLHFSDWALLVIVVVTIWVNAYRREADHRKVWVKTRRLQLQVELLEQVREAHERWQRDVQERLNSTESSRTTSHVAISRAQEQDAGGRHCVPEPAPRQPFPPPEKTTASALAQELFVPAPALELQLAGCVANKTLMRRMAERIRDPNYGMKAFFDDALAAFPELQLFHLNGVKHSIKMSSGLSALTEYQRTCGALFAVYWFLRLDIDGKQGCCFGCDEAWNIRSHGVGEVAGMKEAFFKNMDWSLLQELVTAAVGTSVDRIEAMLSLTAIHDIMKVPRLCPRVAPRHAPYNRYEAGDTINDHDLALAYILEHHPHLIPSFAILPEHTREIVLFAKTKMHFNLGWFVQAEGPPGAMLTVLKSVLTGARDCSLAFYFLHWLTDVAGAEGTPLAGAEKLTVKFPQAVLVSFLWSIPYLQRLRDQTETAVVESYLQARFLETFPLRAMPMGDVAVAVMRLAVMAQRNAKLAVNAFGRLPWHPKHTLSVEMARTGVDGQSFQSSAVVGGGPAFLVYYGPALLQRCTSSDEMLKALCALGAVYASGRRLWPLVESQTSMTVSLEVAELKSLAIDGALSGRAFDEPRVWIMRQLNRREAKVESMSAAEINGLLRDGTPFTCMDTPSVEDDMLDECHWSLSRTSSQPGTSVPGMVSGLLA